RIRRPPERHRRPSRTPCLRRRARPDGAGGGDGSGRDTEDTDREGGGRDRDGVVTSSPAGINCTITAGVAAATGCVARFNQGIVVTLTPSTQLGHAFKEWYNACTGSGACQVT